MDMVRRMMNNSDLPLSLWSEALKIVVYILNRIPSKIVSKTPFELWHGWKPSSLATSLALYRSMLPEAFLLVL